MPALPHHVLITTAVKGECAGAVSYYGVFFVATRPCKIISICEAHSERTTETGTVTLQVEELNTNQRDGEGDPLLVTPFDLKADCNCAHVGDIIEENAELKPCDRLNLLDAGTPTSVRNVCITVELELIP